MNKMVANMFHKVGDAFQFLMTAGDKRTFSYILTDPWIPFYTFFFYVFLVKYVGPKFMENRKPYQLTQILLLYNVFQVVFSAYMFIEFTREGWWRLPNWVRCKSIEENSSQTFITSLNTHHLYYISKYTELFDTVFFVLRKKYNQISFLHVYHHGSMPFFTLLTLRFAPASSISFVGFLNTFVHIFMYGYYMLAALGPNIQKYLWWKKYITSLQLIQFSILFIHFAIAMGSSCNVPKGLSLFMVANIAFNFSLFFIFYRFEYNKKLRAKKSETNNNATTNEVNKLYSNGNAYSNGSDAGGDKYYEKVIRRREAANIQLAPDSRTQRRSS